MAGQQNVTLSYRVQQPWRMNSRNTDFYSARSSFANTMINEGPALLRRFDNELDAEAYVLKLLKVDRPRFFSPCFIASQGHHFDVLGRLQVGQSFQDWCRKRGGKIWSRSRTGAISFDPVLLKILRQILDGMKVLHEQNTGHGDLEFGVSIVGGDKVIFVNMTVDRIAPFAYVHKDLVAFRNLVRFAVSMDHLRPAALDKFELLYDLLPKYNSLDSIRRFEFYIRNNPLFLDVSETYMMIRKIISIYDKQRRWFEHLVKLNKPETDLTGWDSQIQDGSLLAVKYFIDPATGTDNTRYYATCCGSIGFFRNSLGHVGRNESCDDAEVVDILNGDLGFVLPTMYLAMIRDLDMSIHCSTHYLKPLRGLLQSQPTLFK